MEIFEEIKKIEEIDIEIGLYRVENNISMYLDTLKIFYEKLTVDIKNIEKYINEKDFKSFSLLVHSMKSSLGTVGAALLSEAALKLETASKNDDIEYCVKNFPVFLQGLLSFCEKLSAVYQPEESISKLEKEKGDAAFLKENIQKALEAVDDFDSDAGLEFLKDLLSYDYGGEINALLENAMILLRQYKYKDAKEIINKIIRLNPFI